MKKKILCLASVFVLFSVAMTIQMSAAPSSPPGLEGLGIVADVERSEELQMSLGLALGTLTTSFDPICVSQCRQNWFSCNAGCGGHNPCLVMCEVAYTDCLTSCLN